MIVYTMSMEEIQREIDNINYNLRVIGTMLSKNFRKQVKGRLNGKPVFFKKVDSFKYKGNTYLLTYNSRKGSFKDFSWCSFLQIDNVLEGKEYYQIMSNGMIRKITHHFIKRFIERTGCKQEDFLPCFAKEMSPKTCLSLDKEFDFISTLNGVAVVKGFNTLITYINDLNSYKQELKELNIKCTEDFSKKLKENNISYDDVVLKKCIFKI